jgi:hypothetical protein
MGQLADFGDPARELTMQPTSKESTRLVEKPSLELAMTRARLRLPRDPATGLPYMLWGLFAKQRNFEPLGPAATAHVRILLWCIPLTLLVAALVVPLSSLSQIAARVEVEGGTSGAWGEITWGHVVLDCAVSTIFIAFIMREQLLLMDPAIFRGGQTQSLVERLSDAAYWPIAAVGGKVDQVIEQRSLGMAFLPKVQSEKAELAALMVESIEVTLHQALMVEACSVVLSGWGRGLPLPEGALKKVPAGWGTRMIARCLGGSRRGLHPLTVPPPPDPFCGR